MRIYLASRYSRREELCRYRSELEDQGHTVQARWLNGEHQLANDGTPIGEHGEALVEGALRSGEHLALKTEESYTAWLVRFSRFVAERCREGKPEIKMEAFLTVKVFM